MLGLCVLTYSSQGFAQSTPQPVVVELFSSQNCPACPPADQLMGKLSQQSDIIALSCHVDYFGQSRVKLGKSFCTERQKAYSAFKGSTKLFTPQMMVNGYLSAVGYDKADVANALRRGKGDRMSPIIIRKKPNDQYNMSLPNLSHISSPMNLWLAVYDHPHSTGMGRQGPRTYYNVVSELRGLGSWKGNASSFNLPPFNMTNKAGFAVFAQSPKTGKIVTAGQYKF